MAVLGGLLQLGCSTGAVDDLAREWEDPR
jgi:hypothetical protein